MKTETHFSWLFSTHRRRRHRSWGKRHKLSSSADYRNRKIQKAACKTKRMHKMGNKTLQVFNRRLQIWGKNSGRHKTLFWLRYKKIQSIWNYCKPGDKTLRASKTDAWRHSKITEKRSQHIFSRSSDSLWKIKNNRRRFKTVFKTKRRFQGSDSCS